MKSREEWLLAKEEAEAALREMEGKGESKMPEEVTVVMIVASDVATDTAQSPIIYMGQTFRAMEVGCVPLRVIVCPVEPDKDGSGAWLRAIIKDKKWPATKFRSFDKVGPIRSHGNIGDNISHALKLSCEAVTTEFVMFVEPDTVPQKGVVFDLLSVLREDEKIGIVGAQYEPFPVDHVKLGCSMMRTKIAKDINWRSDNGCVCRWLCHTELPNRGLKAVHIKRPHGARHMRYDL
jgi:hypothetical protein